MKKLIILIGLATLILLTGCDSATTQCLDDCMVYSNGCDLNRNTYVEQSQRYTNCFNDTKQHRKDCHEYCTEIQYRNYRCSIWGEC